MPLQNVHLFRTADLPGCGPAVAVPHPVALKFPVAYPVARRDVESARFLSNWIDLKRKDGTIQALYDHWVLGRDAKPPTPRWSVLRNVLHWVN